MIMTIKPNPLHVFLWKHNLPVWIQLQTTLLLFAICILNATSNGSTCTNSSTTLKELMLQRLQVHDQQKHLDPPPKDPSPQRPALDLKPDCPGTYSDLHDAPSEPKNPSFDPPPFVWSHAQTFPCRQSFLFLLQELLPAQHLLLDKLPGCSFALDFMKYILLTFVMLKIDDRYGNGWNKLVFNNQFGKGWHTYLVVESLETTRICNCGGLGVWLIFFSS